MTTVRQYGALQSDDIFSSPELSSSVTVDKPTLMPLIALPNTIPAATSAVHVNGQHVSRRQLHMVAVLRVLPCCQQLPTLPMKFSRHSMLHDGLGT
jgi:hypothetical protein